MQEKNWLKGKIENSPILIIIGALGVILGLFWTIVEISDRFKPEEEISSNVDLIFDFIESKNKNRTIPLMLVYGLNNTGERYIEFPVYLKNSGDKPEKNNFVLFEYNDPIVSLPNDAYFFDNTMTGKLTRERITTGNKNEVMYHLEEIVPKFELGIPEFIYLPEKTDKSLLKLKISMLNELDKGEHYPIVIDYHHTLSMNYLAELQLSSLKTTTYPELRQDLDLLFIIQKNGKKEFKTLGFGEYNFHKKQILLFNKDGQKINTIK